VGYSWGEVIPGVVGIDEESNFWMGLLVLVVFVSLWGLYSVIKSRRKGGEVAYPDYGGAGTGRGVSEKASAESMQTKGVGGLLKSFGGKSGKARDLSGGMEKLPLDFLLGVIENTTGGNKRDVEMRKLSFSEVIRRGQQERIDSGALKVYSVNADGLYGKDIQCAAMEELTSRRGRRSG